MNILEEALIDVTVTVVIGLIARLLSLWESLTRASAPTPSHTLSNATEANSYTSGSFGAFIASSSGFGITGTAFKKFARFAVAR